MSSRNVQLVRRAYEAFNRRDFDGALGFLAPDIEWRTPPNVPDPATWRGRDQVLHGVEGFLEAWTEFRIEVEDLLDAGERVVAIVHYKGRGESTGLEIEGRGPDAHVWTLRHGKAIAVEMLSGTAEALETVPELDEARTGRRLPPQI